MNVAQIVRFAVRGVLANRMRSVLTMSGILIGVAAVIILIAAGTGANAAILASVSSLGSNTLTVTADGSAAGGFGGGPGGGPFGGGGAADEPVADDTGTEIRTARLTLDDAEALVDPELAPDVGAVAPVVTSATVTAAYGAASAPVGTLTGSTPGYLAIQSDTVSAGVLLSDTDYTQRNRVALVGVTVARELVGGDGVALLDQQLQLDGVGYTVIGILTERGSAGPQDQDDRIIAPLTAVQDTLTGYGRIDSIAVQAASAEVVEAAEAQVTALLAARHGAVDFEISSSTDILETISLVTTIFTLLLAAVAGISLLVGGIGVMNIMLVTVTERTREIGIRKAIGAQRSAIVGQFLMEAVVLSLAGGVLGIVVGVSVGSLSVAGFQLIVAPWSIWLAFVVSVAIGLFFGYYPANRAASLRPIDALRYE